MMPVPHGLVTGARLVRRRGARTMAFGLLLLATVGLSPDIGGTRRDVGAVVTDAFWSQSLGIRKQLLVWLPPSYASGTSRRYPVAYYLHGAWGSETDWSAAGHLPAVLDSLVAAGMPEMIVVMPDGDDGWYTTWNWLGDWAACRRNPPRQDEAAEHYCVPWPHYDDYIARDLVSYIDTHYRTRADRSHRGIAGLSMGGYGAIALALAYPAVFAAAASHSGVVAPLLGMSPIGEDTARYARSIDELRGRYPGAVWALIAPAFGKDIAGWTARDPSRLVRTLITGPRAAAPELFLDCGADDPLLAQSRSFVRAARAAGLSTTYAEWPGGHDWEYWRSHASQSASWIAARIGAP